MGASKLNINPGSPGGRADEHSPLLQEYTDTLPENHDHGISRKSIFTPKHVPEDPAARKRLQAYLVAVTAVMAVILDFGAFLANPPQAQILENIICDKYYKDLAIQIPSDSVGDLQQIQHDCNVEPVQAELALVNQLYATFEQIPAILLAVYFGILADKIGRKPILLLSILGIILDDLWLKMICWFPNFFPIRLIWLGSLFRAVGGGDNVATSMLLTAVADVFDEKQRATVLYRLAACVMLSSVLGNTTSAALMAINPWLPFLLCPALLIIGLIITAVFFPETLPVKPSQPSDPTAFNEPNVTGSRFHKPVSTFDRLGHSFHEFKDSTMFLFGNYNIVLLLGCFFISLTERHMNSVQMQYIRVRFDWTFGQAALMGSLRGTFTTFMLFLIFPAYSSYLLTRRSWSVQVKDLHIARVTSWLGGLGFLLLSLSFNIPILIISAVILGMAAGFSVAGRTLITHFVSPTQVGRLYAAVAVMSSLGSLAAGPLAAVTFRWGLSIGGGWVALPWMVATALSVLAIVAVTLVRVEGVMHKRSSSVGSVRLDTDT